MEINEGRNNLYVGNLDTRVTESLLRDIFQTISPVGTVKILHDKNNQGYNYGFVEFFDHKSAEIALNSLDQREIYGAAIKVNWAVQSSTRTKEEPGNQASVFHVFVGDLSNEVNDQVLLKAFQPFGSVTEARVMWDPNTGKTRGYGFVSFKEKADAEVAINQMNGEWLGSRAIRCNWATQRNTDEKSTPTTGLTYEAVVAQTPAYNTTVYVGNIAPETTQQMLYPFFQGFGYIVEMRMQMDKGYCFVKYDAHESAAAAIFRLNGELVNGRQLKCSWGKEKSSAPSAPAIPPVLYGAPAIAPYPQLYGAPPFYQVPPGNPQQQPYGYDYYQGPQYDYSQYNYRH